MKYLFLLLLLISCYKKNVIIKQPINYNRLQKINVDCKFDYYKDLVDCLLKHQKALEQSNKDKEELLNNME